MEVIPKLIGEEENRELVKPISMEDLDSMIAIIKQDKAPVPDGLQINFYKASWEIIKEDLLKCYEESRQLGKILGRMNTTF